MGDGEKKIYTQQFYPVIAGCCCCCCCSYRKLQGFGHRNLVRPVEHSEVSAIARSSIGRSDGTHSTYLPAQQDAGMRAGGGGGGRKGGAEIGSSAHPVELGSGVHTFIYNYICRGPYQVVSRPLPRRWGPTGVSRVLFKLIFPCNTAYLRRLNLRPSTQCIYAGTRIQKRTGIVYTL